MQPNDKKLRDDLAKLKAEEAKHNQTIGSKIYNFFKEGVYNEKVTGLKKQRKKIVHERLPDFDENHAQCFIEFAHGDPTHENRLRGTIIIELFDKDNEVPYTAANFRSLCAGDRSQELHYQNSRVHRIVPDFMM